MSGGRREQAPPAGWLNLDSGDFISAQDNESAPEGYEPVYVGLVALGWVTDDEHYYQTKPTYSAARRVYVEAAHPGRNDPPHP